MILSRRIPASYIKLIPAMAFALLGAFDILGDLWNVNLQLSNLLFNLALFIPLLIRDSLVWGIFGWLSLLFGGYMALALTSWFVQYLYGRHFSDPLMTFGIGYSFCLIGMLCSFCLMHWRHTIPRFRK